MRHAWQSFATTKTIENNAAAKAGRHRTPRLRHGGTGLLFGLLIGLCGQAVATPSSEMPDYHPKPLSGVIRIFGSTMGGQVKAWEAGFKKYHPNVRFDDRFPSGDAPAVGLIAGIADIGSSGREAVLTEFLAFEETFGYDLTELAVASGAYDKVGRSPCVIIYVNKDNPISRLTMAQLDGIFGAARSGGYKGEQWYPERGRSADKDIRTWGQLGLKGEWANRQIDTYGYAFTGMTNYFQRVVFDGGDKWNPNYKQYVESDTKMVTHGADGPGSSQYMLKELAKDKFGIAWSFLPQGVKLGSQIKPLAVAASANGPYYPPTLKTVQSREYPLTRSVFFFIKRPPNAAMDPNVVEFLRYVLSRQGQDAVAKAGEYLPLPAETVRQQRALIGLADGESTQ